MRIIQGEPLRERMPRVYFLLAYKKKRKKKVHKLKLFSNSKKWDINMRVIRIQN